VTEGQFGWAVSLVSTALKLDYYSIIIASYPFSPCILSSVDSFSSRLASRHLSLVPRILLVKLDAFSLFSLLHHIIKAPLTFPHFPIGGQNQS